MPIVSLGEAFVEFVKAEKGELAKTGSFFGPYPSGAPAITISAVSKMGVKSKYIAVVGDDQFGRAFISRLSADGVDISSIRQVPSRTTGMAFVSYTDGSRSFLFHAKDSATALLKKADVDLNGAEILHISGSALGMGWGVAQAVRKAVRDAREAGIPISFDPNVRAELMNDKMRAQLIALSRISDYLLLSEEDGAQLFGGDVQGASLSLSKQKKAVILKMGKKGSILFESGTPNFIKTYPVKEADPTGAGDWYNGAFLAMVKQGKKLAEAADIASAAAAISVTKISPMDGPDNYDEVVQFMKKS
ncbi:MAG: sugar kinase [Thermoprotei archaeon]